MIYCNFPPSSPSFSLWGNGNHMTDFFLYLKMIIMTFMMTQTVKMLPTIGGTRFSSLGQEGLLEKEMAAYSSILAGKSHAQRSLAGYSPWCLKKRRLGYALASSYY